MGEVLSERSIQSSVQGRAGGFPTVRLRRLRRTDRLREMVRETSLSSTDFIYPLFVTEGHGVRAPIGPMPGQFQLSIDYLVEEVVEAGELGIPSVLLFGIPEHKDAEGAGAYQRDGVVQRAVAAIKEASPETVVITDVCLCEYTDHGHCGVLTGGGVVDNDATLELLALSAVSLAAAGADIVAPSAMMDGQIAGAAVSARRGGDAGRANHGLRFEVQLRLLRSIPGRGRIGSSLGRQEVVPDGRRQRP